MRPVAANGRPLRQLIYSAQATTTLTPACLHLSRRPGRRSSPSSPGSSRPSLVSRARAFRGAGREALRTDRAVDCQKDLPESS